MQCEKCGSSSIFRTWNCVTRMVHVEGPLRLWRGVSAMFAGCIPGKSCCATCLCFASQSQLTSPIAHAAYFSIFESTKTYFNAAQHPTLYSFCGAIAAVSHDMIMTPFDVIKQRMQLGYYRSMPHCISTILRTEGIRVSSFSSCSQSDHWRAVCTPRPCICPFLPL